MRTQVCLKKQNDWIREQKERKEKLRWEAEERRRKRPDVSNLGRKTSFFKDTNDGTHRAVLELPA